MSIDTRPAEEHTNHNHNHNDGHESEQQAHGHHPVITKSTEKKGTRITVRISENDLSLLQGEAQKRSITVGAVVRLLIRERLREPSH